VSRRGEEMTVVGPDLVQTGSGYDVDGVARAKRPRFGEASGEEFNLVRDVF